MTSSFRETLPADLVTHVTAICGPSGVEWLDALERTVSELEELWTIRVLEPFAAGEFNFVAPARGLSGDRCVLKIAPPFDPVEIHGEADYLRSRNGEGAVKLIDEDPDRRAILVEHALPGKNLAELFEDDQMSALPPAIDVLRSILAPAPKPGDGVKTLDEWFDGLRRYPSTNFPADYAEKALTIYEELRAQPGRTFYLHGDLHPGNIVSATRSPYLAIDPKGIVGHVGYDIGVFLNNFHWWQETLPDIHERLDFAVSEFASAFDIDPTEIRKWAFAQMVLGAWWTFEDMPEFYDNAVAKSDVWNV